MQGTAVRKIAPPGTTPVRDLTQPHAAAGRCGGCRGADPGAKGAKEGASHGARIHPFEVGLLMALAFSSVVWAAIGWGLS